MVKPGNLVTFEGIQAAFIVDVLNQAIHYRVERYEVTSFNIMFLQHGKIVSEIVMDYNIEVISYG